MIREEGEEEEEEKTRIEWLRGGVDLCLLFGIG